MSNICSLSMDNTHNNVEFGVLQKTSKQSLISMFFYIGRGDTPLPYQAPARDFVPQSKASPVITQNLNPPTHNFLDPPLSKATQYIVHNISKATQYIVHSISKATQYIVHSIFVTNHLSVVHLKPTLKTCAKV